MKQMSEHVYMLPCAAEGDRPDLFLIAGKERSFMVDAGASEKHRREFMEQVARAGLPAPEQLALTHWHWDHSFGLQGMVLPWYANPLTLGYLQLARQQSWDIQAVARRVEWGQENQIVQQGMAVEQPGCAPPIPAVEGTPLKNGEEFELGDVTVQAICLPCDHTDDAVAYLVQQDHLLLLGDALYPDYYHGPNHYSLRRLRGLGETLQRLAFDQAISSHGEELLEKTHLVEFIARLGSGNILPEALASPALRQLLEVVQADGALVLEERGVVQRL